MNREIIFRGKRIDNGEWVEGFLCKTYSRTPPWTRDAIMHENHQFSPAYSCAVINIETVGQYTGLTDKNGKKIFEGDIIECWSEGVKAKGVIEQRIDGLWIMNPSWQKARAWFLFPNERGETDVEIIGNIHDNPELLKGEQA